MSVRLFNTLARDVEEFRPKDPPLVRMYTCGPTVYDHAHIGNLRSFVFEDLLQRHLELRGYRVLRVMNLTDVDDKTIRGARQAGVTLGEFTARYKRTFFEDLDLLRIKRAEAYPEATDPAHIARMISMIATLIERGHAYRADDGSVYFRIASFPAYGRLARLDLENLRPGARVRSDEYEKENVGDFALWKAWDEDDGDVRWDSPWGPGRPGWHIECSAMATALLGDEIDIHCGGVDNIFPHHEAEIAQTECCTGLTFARHWVHGEHLLVDGQKMSKSLGNFYTLRDLLAQGWTGREVRFALLRVNYGLPLNFTLAGLADARAALARLDAWSERVAAHAALQPDAPAEVPEVATEERFENALDANLNISGALGELFKVVTETNRALDLGQLSSAQARGYVEWFTKLQRVLAVEPAAAGIPPEAQALLDRRAAARAAKDWKASDTLRAELAALGWDVKDSKDGQKLTRRAGT